ncbi:MAG: hypothetical protein ABSF45_22680 [Terriglobia bacterium]
MRSHLGCTGSVDLGPFGPDTQKRLEQIAANWLEYSPESSSLVVRHVQPDDVPPLREVAGELLDFLHTVSDAERAQIPGGALYYQDEPTGQYVRMKVWKGGFLTVAWARPDYARAQWEPFRNQPVTLVFEPFQRLNGSVTFEGHPNAADDLRRIIDKTSGQYSQGDYAISSSIRGVEVTLCDVNVDALTVVNAVRYMAKANTLKGEIDVSSFRAGDLEDYCRFSFRAGETWMARPILWSDTPNTPESPADPLSRAA